MSPLFADVDWVHVALAGVGLALVVLGIVFVFVFFSFLSIWVQCVLTGADISIFSLLWMKLRKINYEMIVKQKIALVQAGVVVSTAEMEAHFLSGGNVERVAAAVIAAQKAGLTLPWATAAAIDLAGRDVFDAVRTSVNPKVIDCPAPGPQGERIMLEGVCKDGVRLKVRARVTVRTKLDRLIGGATEETIIARVGEGIVEAIGAGDRYEDILANPHRISAAVLKKGLDSQTAFEIVSIDIAELDVGDNVGAKVRRDAAIAREQEMRALVEENRAKVVLSEAEIPLGIAQAFREGNLGVNDYYHVRNVQADTNMRNSIADSANNDGKDSDNK
ncbi:MAG: flotillin-like protein FloA [Planctomycetes bacterium]|nr:flotillin-like protein FloA [Planctomycetota bacterium]